MIEVINSDSEQVDEIEDNFPYRKGSIKADFIANPFTRYVIYSTDTILGVLNYTIMYDRIEIINIDVQEQARKKGIGSTLLKYLDNVAQDNGVVNITLEVNINNKNAISLYEKHGYKMVAIRKGYYQGIDGILMEKEM